MTNTIKTLSPDRLIDAESVSIAKNVRDLLQREGIPKRYQTKKLMEVLNLSLSQAHRKLNGSSTWDLAQIKQVADYFGETFNSFSEMFAKSPSAEQNGLISAEFCIADRKLACLVKIGPPLHSIENEDYVASRGVEDDWTVIEAAAADGNETYHKVQKLEMALKQAKQLSVAILDDDEGSADNICIFLLDLGFHAEAFYDIETMAQEIEQKPYDAYVIDFLIGHATAEPLIKLIRSKEGRPAPIFLLTGEFNTGRVDANDVARVLVKYNVSIQQKPTRLPILAAELSKALGIA